MKNFRFVLFIFLLPACILGQNSPYWILDDFQSVDTRANSLGKCEIMGATGSNAIFSNPANLSALDSRIFQAGGKLFFGSGENDFYQRYHDSSLDFEIPSKMKFTHFSYAMPYELKDSELEMVIGIGYNTLFDNAYNYNYEEKRENYKNSVERKNYGGVNFITPSMAIKFNENVSGGITFYKSVNSTLGFEYENKSEGTDEINRSTYELEYKASASFFTLGGIAQISDELSLGLMFRSEIDVEYEDGEVEYNQNGYRSTDDYPDSKKTYAPVFGLGAAYYLSEKYLLLFEYQTRKYSDYKEKIDGIGDVSWELDDDYALRFGLEIQGTMPVRLGYFNDPIFMPDGGSDNAVKRTGYTCGLGYYKNPQYKFDIGMEYSKYSQEIFVYGVGEEFEGKFEEDTSMFSFFASLSYFLK